VRLLIDTNIVLEVLLAQEHADEARALLSASDRVDLFLSDFAVHSIGLLLFRRGLHGVFREFLEDVVQRAGVAVVGLRVGDMEAVINAAQKFRLDFDDAYQYVVAEKYALSIVSFDQDFDRTYRGRKTPAEVIAE